MKITGIRSKSGQTSLAAFHLAIAVAVANATALTVQTAEPPHRPEPTTSTVVVNERLSKGEWRRGYRDGYEYGFRAGLHDARAFLPPLERPPGYSGLTRITPYRQGYYSGYSVGYRSGYYHPAIIRPSLKSRDGSELPAAEWVRTDTLTAELVSSAGRL